MDFCPAVSVDPLQCQSSPSMDSGVESMHVHGTQARYMACTEKKRKYVRQASLIRDGLASMGYY